MDYPKTKIYNDGSHYLCFLSFSFGADVGTKKTQTLHHIFIKASEI